MSTPFVTVPTASRVFCKCPLCEKHEFGVSHLFHDAAKSEKGFYEVHWSCNQCQAKFDIRIFADRHVEFSQSGVNENPFIESVVLLRSNTGTDEHPIYAVVRTRSFKKSLDEEKAEPGSSAMHFYYTENTCPTNWFGDTIALVQDGDDDPHGCFEFLAARSEAEVIAALKLKPDVDMQRYDEKDPADFLKDNMRLIFPELYEGGETIDAETDVVQLILQAPTPGSIDKVINEYNHTQPTPETYTQAMIGRGLLKPILYVAEPLTQAEQWVELIVRLERRDLLGTLKNIGNLTEEMIEAIRTNPRTDAYVTDFAVLRELMVEHNIPGFDVPDPLAEGQGNDNEA